MIFFSILICFSFSCQEAQPIDNQSFAPHLISDESNDYTPEELETLKNAEGIKTRIFDESIFNEQNSSQNTYIYNITKVGDEELLKQTLKLETLQEKFENSFELIHLFVGGNDGAELNFHLRKNNLAAPSFIISDISFLEKKVNWTGQFPAVWIKNQAEGINMIYEQKLSKEEILTILQIVTL